MLRISLVCLLSLAGGVWAAEQSIVFNCRPDNDLYGLVTRAGVKADRFDTATEAVAAARPASAVLILAEGYPDRPTRVEPELFERAAARKLTIYIEYPAAIPGMTIAAPARAGWERVVVANDLFADALPRMRIMALNDCHYVPMTASDPMLVLARVAGFDKAVFGLPEQRFPILFETSTRKDTGGQAAAGTKDGRLIIATTKLSGFVSGRYAPIHDWQVLWEHLLGTISPELKGISLKISPSVRPAYGRDEALPADIERQTLRRAAEWYFRSRLLIHPDQERDLHRMLTANKEEAPAPPADAPIGDGSRGILEGYASSIQHDGQQNRRLPIRSDCHGETAMCLALDWAINHQERSRAAAEKMLDYIFFNSEFCTGVRGNPDHPAYGLVAWGAVSPAWRKANYGDDDARVIQGAILATTCLKSDRWNEAIMRSLLGNLRTTGKLGFRGDRIDIPQLEKLGWKHFHDAETVNYAPHYEAALWACYLWAYARTGHAEFLEKARTATRMTMEAYPDRWMWGNDLERARMVLTLAWLVQVEDTAEHRAWLRRITDDLLKYQDACGAIPARIGVTGNAHFLPPTRNEEYGTREVPLVQENGDPVSDQLYTTGFALLALHEAAAATGEPYYQQAEDRLAQFLCRIQIRSDKIEYLDGGWFRAFDYKRWDYWAGSGDIGWGAWCIEAGWGQTWATAALALRIQKTSMWDATRGVNIASHMAAVQQQMARNAGGPWKAGPN